MDVLNSEAIYELYNNRISDKFYQKIGDSYSKNNKVYNNNTKLCDNKIEIKDDDNKVYYYYNFNAMTKDTDMNYSDCIYYHIGSKIFNFETDIIQNTRKLIANRIKENIDNNFVRYKKSLYAADLQALIDLYTQLTDTNIYNNISSSNDLYNILISNNHWITELDLAILTDISNDLIIKVLYNDDLEDDRLNKMTTFGLVDSNKEIFYIYMKKIYNKTVYYYLEQSK